MVSIDDVQALQALATTRLTLGQAINTFQGTGELMNTIAALDETIGAIINSMKAIVVPAKAETSE